MPDNDFELTTYIDIFKTSSNRVRYLILILTIASVLVFTGIMNSRRGGWLNQRVVLARVALRHEVWKDPKDRKAQVPGFIQDSVNQVRAAGEWAKRYSLDSDCAIQKRLEEMEKSHIQNALVMKMPILGLSFDVNDLGTFSGIAFVVLMLLLLTSLSHQHQNLILCLWRVRGICDNEKGLDKQDSRANLLYHGLAMTQVLAHPPTLARWRRGAVRHLPKLFFLPPVSTQLLTASYDSMTFDFGQQLRGSFWAWAGLGWEWIAFLVVLTFALICGLYSQASNARWENTFAYINPSWWRNKPQVSWWRWIHPVDHTRATVSVTPGSHPNQNPPAPDSVS